MIDAHCHPRAPAEEGVTRRFVCAASRADWDFVAAHAPADVSFYGIHPWFVADFVPGLIAALRAKLMAEPAAGVGEIGLDRMKSRDAAVFEHQKPAFYAQLDLAAELRRPVVLHGAKCWGEVVKAVTPYKGRIPAFLFHGFSRTPGLVAAVAALNGYFSVGGAIVNDHAVNYRELVKTFPRDRILVETDGPHTGDKPAPTLAATIAALAQTLATDPATLAATLDANAERFAVQNKN